MEIGKQDTSPAQTETDDEEPDRWAKIDELKFMLMSSIQALPSYVASPMSSYETRLEEFGPVPTNVDLLRKVYERQMSWLRITPSNDTLLSWAADIWDILHSSNERSGWLFEDALSVHRLYSKMLAAPEIWKAKRAELQLRETAERAQQRGERLARRQAMKPPARRNSITSTDLMPLSQLKLATRSDQVTGEVVVKYDSNHAQESAGSKPQLEIIDQIESVSSQAMTDTADVGFRVDEPGTSDQHQLQLMIRDQVEAVPSPNISDTDNTVATVDSTQTLEYPQSLLKCTDQQVELELSQSMADEDDSSISDQQAGAIEECVPPATASCEVTIKYYSHTSGELILQLHPQFKKLAGSKVFCESCLRIQHSYRAE